MRKNIRSDLDGMLWAGVFQLLLMSTFLAGWAMRDALMNGASKETVTVLPPHLQEASTAVAPHLPSVNLEHVPKVNLDVPAPVVQEIIPSGTAEGEGEEAAGEVEPVEPEEPEVTAGSEGRNGTAIGAILRVDRRTGDLEIGSFETVTLEGNADQCLDMGRTLLEDAGADLDQLRILAQTKEITMARICASNGSVVITCRRGQTTISPRRLKLNETCAN